MPVIYATGYSHTLARPLPGSLWFQKPCRIDHVVAALRRGENTGCPTRRYGLTAQILALFGDAGGMHGSAGDGDYMNQWRTFMGPSSVYKRVASKMMLAAANR